MKKSILLLTISVFYSNEVFGQLTTNLDVNSIVFVDKEALYYNEGGAQIKDALFQNKGKVMVVGNAGDLYKTLKTDNSVVTQLDAQQNIGGRFLNELNEPSNYPLANTTSIGNNYTYGQLFLSGLNQSDITGYAQQEHRNVNHGAYQQIALPFYKKELPSLSNEFGKSFSPVRWSQNEILAWNNQKALFDNLNFAQGIVDPTAYYILGNKNNSLNVSSVTRTVTGIPHTDGNEMIKTLANAGTVNFGTNGNAINQYNERYNTYLQDGFELQQANGGMAWQGNYGKNLYQFGNPFLMNIDLRNIFIEETSGDGNFISNIYGIRVEQSAGTISYAPGVGGGATSFRYVTFDSATSSPVGDVDWLIVRPLSVFVIKLKDNALPQTLNFNSLRRFAFTPRLPNVPYSPTAIKSISVDKKPLVSTVKQLGVIALDQNNNELGRTYYVVSPSAQTGHSSNSKYQIASASTNVIGTYEENLHGGYDQNYIDKYWLYINEANQESFLGKPIPAVIYNTAVKALKFELRENSILSDAGTTSLSDGIPFFYSINGQINPVSQNTTIPINAFGSSLEFQLYYGSPNTLQGGEVITKTKTIITFNPAIKQHIVHFSPQWKSATIEVFDMAGRLIIHEKNYNTSSDYVIQLNNVDATYFVKATSSTGEFASGKIINNKYR